MVRLLACLLLVACQGHGEQSAPPARQDTPKPAPVPDAALIAGDAGSDEPHVAPPEEPETVDPGKAIADLGAIPAWQAVVDRANYLARRGQHGVVFGTIGAAIQMLGPTPEPQPDAGK